MAIQQKFNRKNRYKDFDLSFTKHPLTNDIGVKTDVAAINQSVKNIIFTSFYERPFQPTFGSNLRALLFEPADPITIANLRQVISSALANYEPRVNVTEVNIRDDVDNNAYGVQIKYQILDLNEEADANIVLERLR